MINSVLTLWEEMNDALKSNGDCDLCLTKDDKIVLSELRQFLKPFGDLTDLVSLEAAHLSLMPLIIREVKDAASHSQQAESDVITLLKNTVLGRIDSRLKTDEIVNTTALLDPSLKSEIMADVGEQDARKILCDHTKRAVERLNQSKRQSSEACSTCSACSVGSSSASSAVQGFTAKSAVHSDSVSMKTKLLSKFNVKEPHDKHKQIENEVNACLCMELSAIHESPLTFWKQQEENLPNLSVLAWNYLAISASSVAVKGMFSIAGLLLNSKRSSMAAYKANLLSFLHDNYPKYFPVGKQKEA
jgi:hypothetical protein